MLTMKNMLGVALRDFSGPLSSLVEKLSGEDGQIWLAELNKFSRGEVCWRNGVAHPKLKWSENIGPVRNINHFSQLMQDYRTEYGGGWRLPTRKELERFFVERIQASDLEAMVACHCVVSVFNGQMMTEAVYSYDGRGHFSRSDHSGGRYFDHCSLFLCCDTELPV